MEKQEAILSYEKSTKGTFRFKENVEEGETPICRQIYLNKSLFGSDPPKKIRISIESIK